MNKIVATLLISLMAASAQAKEVTCEIQENGQTTQSRILRNLQAGSAVRVFDVDENESHPFVVVFHTEKEGSEILIYNATPFAVRGQKMLVTNSLLMAGASSVDMGSRTISCK